jgi:hypothetical protein
MKDSEIDYSDIPRLDRTFPKKANDGVAAGEKAIDDFVWMRTCLIG